MKRITVTLTTIILVIVCATLLPAPVNAGDDGKLTIPWDEFKKLLNLDDDQIVVSMETFQKLLAQTGADITPLHTLSNGDVVLTREQFNSLVDKMRPPMLHGPPPPFDHLITKAKYTGEMKENSTDFTASFVVHVLKQDAYVKVPILPAATALADVRVGNEPALVVVENGYHNVVLPRAGEYTVTATYSVKSSLERGPHRIDLAISQTPITLLTLTMPLKDIDVEIPQAQQVLTTTKDGTTEVSAVIGQGSAISVMWKKALAVTEKIPAKLYGEVHHLVSIQDDVLKTRSIINYTILHNEVDAVRLAIPADVNVLSVTGEGVGEWQEQEQDGRRILVVPFTYGKKGNVTVNVTTERPLSESTLANAFDGLETLDTIRETGFIGVELGTSAEVIAKDSEGLEPIAVQKLPPDLINSSARPLIMGFKYLKHPYSLVFDITKHEKVAVPVATISSASVVTLFTEDGKLVHRLVYEVQNNAKQFLEIQLPEKTDVWSVFVDRQPVESSVNHKGKLLVPLIRSRSVNNRLDAFPVEVIYCTVQDRFAPIGVRASVLPTVDLLTSQLIWSVYLPNEYSYVYFKSTLEKEELIRGVNVSVGKRRQYDEDAMRELRASGTIDAAKPVGEEQLRQAYKGEAKSSFRNFPMEKDQLASQMNAELEFTGRLEGIAGTPASPYGGGSTSTGVMPLHVRVPTSGQVYRFARTIIQPNDPLSFSVVYTQPWLIKLARWLILALAAWILYLNRRRFFGIARRVLAGVMAAVAWIKEHEETLGRYARSVMTPIVLLGLVMIFVNISLYATLLCFFLLWLSLAYHGLRLWRKRAQLKPAPKGPTGEPGATTQ